MADETDWDKILGETQIELDLEEELRLEIENKVLEFINTKIDFEATNKLNKEDFSKYARELISAFSSSKDFDRILDGILIRNTQKFNQMTPWTLQAQDDIGNPERHSIAETRLQIMFQFVSRRNILKTAYEQLTGSEWKKSTNAIELLNRIEQLHGISLDKVEQFDSYLY